MPRDYKVNPPRVYSIELARVRLERILGAIPEWSELRTLTKANDVDAPEASIIASAFNAALEFARDGRLEVRQLGHFEPIYVRTRQEKGKRDKT